MASGSFGLVRRLTPRGNQSLVPTKAILKTSITGLLEKSNDPIVLAFSGCVSKTQRWSIAAGSSWAKCPDDESLELEWIANAIRGTRSVLLFELIGEGAIEAAQSAHEIFSGTTTALCAVYSPQQAESLIQAVTVGLRGAACTDEGNITSSSLCTFLDTALPNVAVSLGEEQRTSLLYPPSPLRLWDSRAADWPMVASERPDLSGSVLPGGLRILRPIASGAFGTVYRGHQVTLDRPVAIKVLDESIADAPTRMQLFVAEVRAVASIRHPNVVTIFQADVSPSGRPFYAMELLDGTDLQSTLDTNGPFPVARAFALIGEVLRGLGAVHAAGVIHSDIKPSNILLAQSEGDERVVLVDFGLSQLWSSGSSAKSVGGTPSYMAPEQLLEDRIDQRSDLYAVGVVLYEMLTGSRQPGSYIDLELIDDELALSALAQALSADPSGRFQSTGAFASALQLPVEQTSSDPKGNVFRYLAAFERSDAERFWGRNDEIEDLVSLLVSNCALILTAPSGVGKTSLIRAGLLPRLERLGIETSYIHCRQDGEELANLAASLRADAPLLSQRAIILDQVETLLVDKVNSKSLEEFKELLTLQAASNGRILLLLSLREDFLARILDEGGSIVRSFEFRRLRPLKRSGARTAIEATLAEHHLAMEQGLVEVLLDDLEVNAKALAPRLGWSVENAIYPPHLQLAGSALVSGLDEGERLVTLAAFQRTGGLGQLIAEHFNDVIDEEFLGPEGDQARAILQEMIGPADTRITRSEQELVSRVDLDRTTVVEILERLRRRGIVVPLSLNGSRGWELVHDQLISHLLTWIGRRDLGRLKARDLVRHHLQRSKEKEPSLLNKHELREVEQQSGLISELEIAWAKRKRTQTISPGQLIRRSRRALLWKRLVGMLAATVIACLITGFLVIREQEKRSKQKETNRRRANIGRFVLILQPFDWDEALSVATALDPNSLPGLDWELLDVDPNQPEFPGTTRVISQSRRIRPLGRFERRELVESNGGPAFLKVRHRGRDGATCSPSVVRLRWLPGYTDRDFDSKEVRVWVPSCAASRAGTTEIPGGTFHSGGQGKPPTRFPGYVRPDQQLTLSSYRIDTTEVTNASYSHYALMATVTGRDKPAYPSKGPLSSGSLPDFPVVNVSFWEAHDYCNFLGKRLPLDAEWEKAARGGLFLDQVKTKHNPVPERNFPWGGEREWSRRANLSGDDDGFLAAAPVKSFAQGRSPYGVYDLAGNVHEWIAERAEELGNGRHHIIRGGSFDVLAEKEHHSIAYTNARDQGFRSFDLGIRCVEENTDGERE